MCMPYRSHAYPCEKAATDRGVYLTYKVPSAQVRCSQELKPVFQLLGRASKASTLQGSINEDHPFT
ncbi:hypothetical protein WG66_016828 [Moniliophthora roreri]|nr:hypothetical protein WG66_016828 [Moniliophthora roreri]